MHRYKYKKKTDLILKKTLLFFSAKSNYQSQPYSKKNFTGFFSNNSVKIDNYNLFSASNLFSKISDKFENLKIQNIFFKNKLSCALNNNSFDNYFVKSKYMISKKKIPKTNYVIKKPNLMFKMKPGYKVLWRGYRNEYNMLANLNFYRQKRLTNHFLNFKKTNSLLILRNFEFSRFHK